jgi:hypothetical protein
MHAIHRFQVIQRSRDDLLIYIIKEPNFSAQDDRRMAEILDQIHREFSASVKINLQYVEDIPLTQTGKHRFTISEVGQQYWK